MSQLAFTSDDENAASALAIQPNKHRENVNIETHHSLGGHYDPSDYRDGPTTPTWSPSATTTIYQQQPVSRSSSLDEDGSGKECEPFAPSTHESIDFGASTSRQMPVVITTQLQLQQPPTAQSSFTTTFPAHIQPHNRNNDISITTIEPGPSTSHQHFDRRQSDTSSEMASFRASFEADCRRYASMKESGFPKVPKVKTLRITPDIEPVTTVGTILSRMSEINAEARASSGGNPQFAPSQFESNNMDYLLQLLPPSQPTVSSPSNENYGQSEDQFNMNEVVPFPVDDPIILRGTGNMTLFGLSNSFATSFPSALLGRVSREEFDYTINRINQLLEQQHTTNSKFLLLGCLCCCCSLGCSVLWPIFALSKRTRNSLEKVTNPWLKLIRYPIYAISVPLVFTQLLAMENSRLYNKLGLDWKLSKQQCHTNNSFMEYVLVIHFLPKVHIYQPD